MAARHMHMGLLATLVAGQSVPAQAPWPTTASSPQPCARESALVVAEDTTPGILQRLTGDSLADCLPDAAVRPNRAVGTEGTGR